MHAGLYPCAPVRRRRSTPDGMTRPRAAPHGPSSPSSYGLVTTGDTCHDDPPSRSPTFSNDSGTRLGFPAYFEIVIFKRCMARTRAYLGIPLAMLMIAIGSGFGRACPCMPARSQVSTPHACCAETSSSSETAPCSHSCRFCQASPMSKAALPTLLDPPSEGWTLGAPVQAPTLPLSPHSVVVIPAETVRIHGPPKHSPLTRAPPVRCGCGSA